MRNENLNKVIYSQQVVEFVAVANEFCNFTEKVNQYPTDQLLDISRKLLALMYLKVSMLPNVEATLDEELEKYVSELDYNLLNQKWLNKLGEYDLFHEVIDPEIQFGNESVTASISENILDIYQDIKDFVISYSIGNEDVMNDSLSECINHFQSFWGQRLVNVLRAIHQLSFAGIEWDQEINETKVQTKEKNTQNWVDRFFDHDPE